MRFILFSIILLISASAQTEIRAWKIPLEQLTERLWPRYNAPDHRVPLLDKPPGKSAFFEDGDRLFDLSALLESIRHYHTSGNQIDPFAAPTKEPDTPLEEHSLEWLVWNERTSMVVAKGHPISLALFDEALPSNRLPLLIGTTVTLETSDGVRELISLSSRSGESVSGKTKALDVEFNHSLTSDRNLCLIDYCVDYLRPNGDLIRVQSSGAMEDGESLCIASWREGKTGWSMHLSWNATTIWETPISELKWIEKEGRLANYESHLDNDPMTKSGFYRIGNLIARPFQVPPDFLERISDKESPAPHQFVDDDLLRPFSGFFGEGLIDAKPALRAIGVPFSHPKSLAFLSAGTSVLYAVNSPEAIDLIEQITSPAGGYQISTAEISVDWEQGDATLSTLSGHKASIDFYKRDERTCLFEVAPNMRADDKIIDLSIKLDPQSAAVSLRSSTTVTSGREHEIGRYTDQGQEYPVTLKPQTRTYSSYPRIFDFIEEPSR